MTIGKCLFQVALGNPKIDVKHGDEDHLDNDINSLKILGLNAPAEDFNARLPYGKFYQFVISSVVHFFLNFQTLFKLNVL